MELSAVEVGPESSAYEIPPALRQRRASFDEPIMHSLGFLYADTHAVDLGDLFNVPSQKPLEILVLTARANDKELLALAKELLERGEMRDRTDQVHVPLAGEWRGENRV